MSRRDEIQDLYREGMSQGAIARHLDLSPSTVSYHMRKLGYPPKCTAYRYDWDEVQRYYDAGNSARKCAAKFGFNLGTFHQARLRGAIQTRPAAMPLAQLLVRRPRNRNYVKLRLIRAGLKEGACEECAIADWRGRSLSFALHHRNGDRHDNRLENLVLLCPNCHSQTENFAGRNTRRRVGSHAD